MAISEKQRKALLKSKKRRAKNPRPTVTISKPLAMKVSERDRYTQRHATILLSIDKTIAECYRQNSSLTDKDLFAALRQSIKAGETSPAESNVQSIVDALQQTFQRSFVAAELEDSRAVWIDGLRAIYSSVETRISSRIETAYLDFVTNFVRKARAS